MRYDYNMHSIGRNVEERVNFQNPYEDRHIHLKSNIVYPQLLKVPL